MEERVREQERVRLSSSGVEDAVILERSLAKGRWIVPVNEGPVTAQRAEAPGQSAQPLFGLEKSPNGSAQRLLVSSTDWCKPSAAD